MNLMPWRSKKTSEAAEAPPPAPREDTSFEGLLDRFLGESWPFGSGSRSVFGSWVPPVDITETEKEIVVRSEIPGVDPDDLSLTVSGDVLTLRGEKSATTEKRRESYFHTERRFGAFHRNIPLPSAVDPDKVKAEYEHGVLTITLRRKADAEAKRVRVTAHK